MNIEVAIPVYNEERRLENGLRMATEYIHRNQLPVTIVIADNGSTDRTREIAERLVREMHGIRYCCVGTKGVGRALQKAWGESSADIVGYMDVDLSTDIEHLAGVVRSFEDPSVSVLSGSRLLPGSRVEGRKLIREVVSRVFNLILKARLGIGFTDGMCGFKFIRRNLFNRIRDEYSPLSLGWFFNCEILVKSEWAGHRVKDIPVTWVDDPDSRVDLFALTQAYLGEIERLRKAKAALPAK